MSDQQSPNWNELAKFINDQAENDRKVINWWFTLAAGLIGIVLIVVSLIGWKTISDVKKSAETTARETAKAKVEEVLKQPDVQKLVRDTATELFQQGAFREEIDRRVSELVSAEISSHDFHRGIADAVRGELATRTAPRLLTESEAKAISAALRSTPEGWVDVRTGMLAEQSRYARQLVLAMRASPSWTSHVRYAEPGTLAGLEENRHLFLDGIVVVVTDVGTAPGFARELEKALKDAGVEGVRLGACGCADPPKAPNIWLYVGEKTY